MSCACCDEITEQMRGWRERAQKLQAEVDALKRSKDSLAVWGREQLDRGDAVRRSNNALRGALTKAKKRIAELKGGGE